MTTDHIIELCFCCPFAAILGLGAGLLVCALFGVDLTECFRRDKEDK